MHGVGELLQVLPVGNILGEGVLWDEVNQLIWWTDIEAACVFCYCTVQQQSRRISMPYRVGSFGLTVDPDQLIVAFDRGIALYRLSTHAITWIATPEAHLAGHRFNDGRVDRQGRFWAGTMQEAVLEQGGNPPMSQPNLDLNANKMMQQSATQSAEKPQMAALYCIDVQRKCHKVLSGLSISNGLCWSPDGQMLYHSDSPTQTISQYPLTHMHLPANAHSAAPNMANEIAAANFPMLINKQLFAKTDGSAFPDGAEVDADGFMWSAHWGGGQVVRYNKRGEIVLRLCLPVTNPTNLTFGGPNLDWLIITSAKQGLNRAQLASEPQAGHVFIYQLQGINGLVQPRYRFS